MNLNLVSTAMFCEIMNKVKLFTVFKMESEVVVSLLEYWFVFLTTDKIPSHREESIDECLKKDHPY